MLRPFTHLVASCCVLLGVVASVCTPLPKRTQQLPFHVALKERKNREVQNVACANSGHFATPPLVSQRNDFWETSAEIPYWWRVTSHIWVVLLIGWKSASFSQKHYPDLRSETSSVWNFFVRSSDVISRENHRRRGKMSAVFSGY